MAFPEDQAEQQKARGQHLAVRRSKGARPSQVEIEPLQKLEKPWLPLGFPPCTNYTSEAPSIVRDFETSILYHMQYTHFNWRREQWLDVTGSGRELSDATCDKTGIYDYPAVHC
jgi:hypothetical protein